MQIYEILNVFDVILVLQTVFPFRTVFLGVFLCGNMPQLLALVCALVVAYILHNKQYITPLPSHKKIETRTQVIFSLVILWQLIALYGMVPKSLTRDWQYALWKYIPHTIMLYTLVPHPYVLRTRPVLLLLRGVFWYFDVRELVGFEIWCSMCLLLMS